MAAGGEVGTAVAAGAGAASVGTEVAGSEVPHPTMMNRLDIKAIRRIAAGLILS